MNFEPLEDRIKNAARWAFYAHYSRLLGPDGALLDAREAAGGMIPQLVGDIADEYWVTRTIPAVSSDYEDQHAGEYHWKDHHRFLIAEAINETRWSHFVCDRAEQCITLNDELGNAMKDTLPSTRLRQGVSFLSGLSKISWFDAPSQPWTIYDKYACKAVIGSSVASSEEKMRLFYATMSDRGFESLFSTLSSLIGPLGIPLYAGKIIDHFLMASPVQSKTMPTDFNAGQQRLSQTLRKRLLPSTREQLDRASILVEEALLDSHLVIEQKRKAA